MSDRIAHYNILSTVGSGALGTVYRARDTRLGRTVALKVLRKDADPELLRRLRLAPPLIVDEESIERAVEIVGRALGDLRS